MTENIAGLHLPSMDSLSLDQAANGISVFADGSSFSEGVSVITIGFPLGIGSKMTHNLPIVRKGIVGQGLTADGHFLVDGIASHGNSGSPVFDLTDGKLLGIVVAFPADYISMYDDSHQLVATLPYNSGLSICISSFEIWSMVP
jgi:hypothetical protein